MDVAHPTALSVFSSVRFRAASGFTLVEVLIAVSITAIGLLGLASLQLQGLRGTHEASLRTQAVALASEVGETLHAEHGVDAAAVLPDAEITAWQARVAQTLPLGEGRITTDAAATVVTVRWTAHDAAGQLQLSVAP